MTLGCLMYYVLSRFQRIWTAWSMLKSTFWKIWIVITPVHRSVFWNVVRN